MFKILEQVGKAVVSKVSATVVLEDKTTFKYVATPLKENVVLLDDEGKPKEGLWVSKVKAEGLHEAGEAIFVTEGFAEEHMAYFGYGPSEPDYKGIEITVDSKAKGVVKRVDGWEYKQYVNMNMQNKEIEGMLYRPVEFSQIITGTVPGKKNQEPKDLSWTKDKDYKQIYTERDVEELLQELYDAGDEGYVGFDTETSGLNMNYGGLDKIVGMSISTKKHSGRYISLASKVQQNVEIGKDKFLERIEPFISTTGKFKRKLVGHNLLFDAAVGLTEGIEINIAEDTFVRQALLQIDGARDILSLKGMISKLYGIDVLELKEIFHKIPKNILEMAIVLSKKGLITDPIIRDKLLVENVKADDLFDYRFVPKEFSDIYGPADGDFPLILLDDLKKKWDNSLDFAYQEEIANISVLAKMNYGGFPVDTDKLYAMAEKAKVKEKELEKKMYGYIGREINLNSSQEVSKVFYGELGLPKEDKYLGDAGKSLLWKGKRDLIEPKHYSSGAAAIDKFEQYENPDGTPMYPFLNVFADWRKVSKQINDFYLKLPVMARKGRIYPNYGSLLTRTQRLQCAKPNLQQTEPTTRLALRADSKDHKMFIADFSQIELRLLMGVAGQQDKVDYFWNFPDADIHTKTVADMEGLDESSVPSSKRKVGKVLNFGIVYGISDPGLALQIHRNDTPFHVQMASEAKAQYLHSMPKVAKYLEEEAIRGVERGHALTLFGRRRDLSRLVKTGRKADLEKAKRQSVNHAIQSLAADVLKLAMLRTDAMIQDKGWDKEVMCETYEGEQEMLPMVRFLGNVHDEIILSVHKDIDNWLFTHYLREAMQVVLDFPGYNFPPLYAGVSVGDSWYDGKADDLEAPVGLMDAKCAKAVELEAKGHKFERDEEPVETWRQEIRQYAFEQIRYELDNTEGEVETYLDVWSNIRLRKYANSLEKYNSKVLIELYIMKPDVDGYALEVSGKLNKLLDAIELKLLEKVKAYLEKKEITPKNVDKINHVLRYYLEYSEYFANELKVKDVSEVLENFKAMSKGELEAIEGTLSKVSKVADEDIDLEEEDVETVLKRAFKQYKTDGMPIYEMNLDDIGIAGELDETTLWDMYLPKKRLRIKDLSDYCRLVLHHKGKRYAFENEVVSLQVFKKFGAMCRNYLYEGEVSEEEVKELRALSYEELVERTDMIQVKEKESKGEVVVKDGGSIEVITLTEEDL